MYSITVEELGFKYPDNICSSSKNEVFTNVLCIEGTDRGLIRKFINYIKIIQKEIDLLPKSSITCELILKNSFFSVFITSTLVIKDGIHVGAYELDVKYHEQGTLPQQARLFFVDNELVVVKGSVFTDLVLSELYKNKEKSLDAIKLSQVGYLKRNYINSKPNGGVDEDLIKYVYKYIELYYHNTNRTFEEVVSYFVYELGLPMEFVLKGLMLLLKDVCWND